MSGGAMALAAFLDLALACAPGLPADPAAARAHAQRLAAYAMGESGLRPDAVSPPNRDGSRDYGLMQLNGRWVGRPGFPRTVREALEPCANVAAGARVLAAADRAAACLYNAGRPSCPPAYPDRVQAATVRVARALDAAPAAPRPAAVPPASSPARGGCIVPDWDPFARCPPALSPPPRAHEARADAGASLPLRLPDTRQ